MRIVESTASLDAKGGNDREQRSYPIISTAAEALREHGSHVHNVEACDTNLFHVISFECIHSYDI